MKREGSTNNLKRGKREDLKFIRLIILAPSAVHIARETWRKINLPVKFTRFDKNLLSWRARYNWKNLFTIISAYKFNKYKKISNVLKLDFPSKIHRKIIRPYFVCFFFLWFVFELKLICHSLHSPLLKNLWYYFLVDARSWMAFERIPHIDFSTLWVTMRRCFRSRNPTENLCGKERSYGSLVNILRTRLKKLTCFRSFMYI